MNFERILWGCAFGLMGLAYGAGLLIDLTGDSALYSAITRQMVESGDWFNLKINGVPYDQKPHLFFWLAGIGVRLFGYTNFAFKLFPFLYGLAGIYFTYCLGKQLYSREAGKLAALFTLTSQMVFLYFFDFHTDSILQTGVVLALWQLAAYLQTKKSIHFVFSFVGVGLAMMTKGPVGVVLPFFAVLFYLLVQKDFRQIFHLKWIPGIAISFLVVSPALIHLYNSFGLDGLKFFFITNNVGRITGEYAGSSTDYFYYTYNALWAFLPWTLWVISALVMEFTEWVKKKNADANGVFLIGGTLLFIIILSIAKGKAPNYFLITIIPFSVLTGKWIGQWNELTQKTRRVLGGSQFIFITFILTALIFVLWVFRWNNLFSNLISLILFVLLLLIPVILKTTFRNQLILSSVILIGSLNLFLNTKVLPELFRFQGARQVLNIFERESDEESQLCNFEVEQYELFFYSKKDVEQIDDWEELKKKMARSGTWLYTNEVKYNDILKMNFQIEKVYEIKYRGMNRVNLAFLNPNTREKALKTNYLIVIGDTTH